ncbi:unnamed protein product [Rangifer tarandus platyrhynchus]|uniref:Uncharacterized protein n=1 Tax=Rangifer tarandus platyrhynchus TaxID=3082113 RepID=A0ABN8YBY7_RANTA|nr:unnamed protein product [Rangifer tarandus platyrhynchus]
MQGLSRLEEPLASSQLPMQSATPVTKKTWEVLPSAQDSARKEERACISLPPSPHGESQLNLFTYNHGGTFTSLACTPRVLAWGREPSGAPRSSGKKAGPQSHR